MAAKGSLYPPRPAAAYTARGLGLLALSGHPLPPLSGRVYGGDKGGVDRGSVGGEWGLAGWLGGWGGEPLV